MYTFGKGGGLQKSIFYIQIYPFSVCLSGAVYEIKTSVSRTALWVKGKGFWDTAPVFFLFLPDELITTLNAS